MSDYISLTGPIELVNGQLMIRIPLGVGGDPLAPLAAGIGTIEGENLVVVILPWLAEKLHVQAGSLVNPSTPPPQSSSPRGGWLSAAA